MNNRGINIFWIAIALLIISLEVFLGPLLFIKTESSLLISFLVIFVWSIVALKNLHTLSISTSNAS